MKAGDYVRVTKTGYPDNPSVRTLSKEEFIASLVDGHYSNTGGYYIDYWMEGLLINTPTIGGILHLDRQIRNGERVAGEFTSSFIQQIIGPNVITENSIYFIQIKNPNANPIQNQIQ